MGRRGNFRFVLVIVVVLGLLMGKAIEHEGDDEHDTEKTRISSSSSWSSSPSNCW
jgi:hypothetical protein